jgi:hypothetical protein
VAWLPDSVNLFQYLSHFLQVGLSDSTTQRICWVSVLMQAVNFYLSILAQYVKLPHQTQAMIEDGYIHQL